MDNIKCIDNYHRLKELFEKGYKGNPDYQQANFLSVVKIFKRK